VTGGAFRHEGYERGALLELARDAGPSARPAASSHGWRSAWIPTRRPWSTSCFPAASTSWRTFRRTRRTHPRVANTTIVRAPDLSYGFVCWNTARPLFADANVRRALALAIDRRAIVEGLLPADRTPRPTGRSSRHVGPHPALAPLPSTPPSRRRLLAAAGFRDRPAAASWCATESASGSISRRISGSSLRARHRPDDPRAASERRDRRRPASCGVRRLTRKHEKHDFDAFVSSWREATKVDLKSVFHSASIAGATTIGSLLEHELDAILDRAVAKDDTAAARSLWRRAEEIINRDQPLTFLFERDRPSRPSRAGSAACPSRRAAPTRGSRRGASRRSPAAGDDRAPPFSAPNSSPPSSAGATWAARASSIRLRATSRRARPSSSPVPDTARRASSPSS